MHLAGTLGLPCAGPAMETEDVPSTRLTEEPSTGGRCVDAVGSPGAVSRCLGMSDKGARLRKAVPGALLGRVPVWTTRETRGTARLLFLHGDWRRPRRGRRRWLPASHGGCVLSNGEVL